MVLGGSHLQKKSPSCFLESARAWRMGPESDLSVSNKASWGHLISSDLPIVSSDIQISLRSIFLSLNKLDLH